MTDPLISALSKFQININMLHIILKENYMAFVYDPKHYGTNSKLSAELR